MSHYARLLAILFSTALAGCASPQAPAPEGDAEPVLELVTYSLHPSQSATVQGVLSRLFRSQSEAVGKYSEAPGGRIAVLAPASVQAGVAELIEQVGQTEAVETGPANVRFSYFLVGGESATQSGPVSADLTPLADTLGAIEGWDGPQRFWLAGHSTLTSLDGERAQSSSARLGLSQVATIDPTSGHIVADIELSVTGDASSGPAMETRVQLKPGQTLILSTLDGGAKQPDNLYVIVRADVLPQG